MAHHLTALITGEAQQQVEPLRRRWDPEAAESAPAHVVLVYPEEAEDVALLAARVRAAAGRVTPFPLRLGEALAHEGHPGRGIYLRVIDPTGVWSWLREFLLAPPFAPRDVLPHVALAPPRVSMRNRRAWRELRELELGGEFRVAELQLVQLERDRWKVEEVFSLASVPPPP